MSGRTPSASEDIIATLERRRERIERARNGLDMTADAYTIVANDLRAAAAARAERQRRRQEEPAQ
jgi:hypothetical protein